jgi:xanthine dehydrogenase C subunit
MAINSYDFSADRYVWQPQTVEDAWQHKQSFGEASKYVSGGTLLRTQWESGLFAAPPHLISLSGVHELHGMEWTEEWLTIGAMTAIGDIRKHPDVQREFAVLAEAARTIAAPAVRNMATLGGNVLSVVGDFIPALAALGAELYWFDGKARKVEAIADWLHMQQTGGPHKEERILLQIRMPRDVQESMTSDMKRSPRRIAFYHKVGRRESFTPSVATVCVDGKLQEDGTLERFQVAAGGGATIPMRLASAEYFLNGATYSAHLLSQVHQAVLDDFETYTDAFATADYRKHTVANLIAAGLWRELDPSVPSERGGNSCS